MTHPQIESLIAQGNSRFAPYWGWHDDHRDQDGTAAYQPALQQVKAEFYGLVSVLRARRSCLQLGAGHCDAPHAVWQCLFDNVVTIDWRLITAGNYKYPGADTASRAAFAIAEAKGPYDLLFIDADHTYEGVARDFTRYSPLVSPGGIIAFHDALPRLGFPEVEVWRFIERSPVNIIGDEVGVAWFQV